MPVNADEVVVALRAAGIDAGIEDHSAAPFVTINPGDASTFLELLTGGGQRENDIISRFASTCPHNNEDDEICRYCGWSGDGDDWPAAVTEHADNCLWATANRWLRRR